uniref:fructose-bisphosphate aldolase n=1 Tax=Oryza barthii TaxID=65489 RepID=A0A0D3H3L7_9ORYZ
MGGGGRAPGGKLSALPPCQRQRTRKGRARQGGSLVLVADESTGTIGKRLASINVENVEENRRALRKLLFTVPCVLDCLSGVILFEETLYQSTRDGTPFVDPASKSSQLANTNAQGVARYTIICQENGLVPIVEPEILVDGEHGIEVCTEVTERVLAACYKVLSDHVLLEGTTLSISDTTKIATVFVCDLC